MAATRSAHREAARHIAGYILRPDAGREILIPLAGVAAEARVGAVADPDRTRNDEAAARALLQALGEEHEEAAYRARAAAFVASEWRAIESLADALRERETLAAAEADLIVDVARGDATAADLRHYRAVTRQRRCGLE